jgi:hypothetical protein
MVRRISSTTVAAGAILAVASQAAAGTMPYFTPLTQSAPVTAPNSDEELNAPWIVPTGVRQYNLTSMREIEADPSQSISRAPDIFAPGGGQPITAGSSQSMWDMAAFDATGRYVFIPHESPWSAGLSRYDRWNDRSDMLWNGDGQGALGNWNNDFAAFDPATFTPNCTVMVAEEWSGEGRLFETTNPFAPVEEIEVRELESIANVAHEGLRFSADRKTLYFIDEWNSGSIYKFVMPKKGDYTKGQTFVLAVDAFAGNPADNFNQPSNVGQPRTGLATWVPITDALGNPLTTADPFRNGPTNDPRTNSDTRGGRPAADEANGTPYGRPEDMEIARLASGKEVVYFAATSERAIYSIEELGGGKAMVRLFVGPQTPTNLGFAPTTGVLNSPDNLAQDAFGNLFIIEDAPNGDTTGGDIWFARDLNNDGVSESIDHFMSLRVAGSEGTGMIFNPLAPSQFVVFIQHPESTDLTLVPNGFGDAMWEFDLHDALDRRTLGKLYQSNLRNVARHASELRNCKRAIVEQANSAGN